MTLAAIHPAGDLSRRPGVGRRTVAGLLLALVVLACANQAQATQPRKKRAVQPDAVVTSVDYSVRDDVRQFAAEMASSHQFAAEELLRIFSQVRHDSSVIRFMRPQAPDVKRSWTVYRKRFLDPLRQREGLRFWREHETTVNRAAEQFGIPPEIIVSIIGVETIYGRITGEFRVFDALTVLGFDYPRRAEYFRSELEQFLLFARENDLDVFSVKGSFAGAIGLPQFMPGSIRRYAVDFDGDGRIDLRGSPIDAIGSVARFLAEHGWDRGKPTHFAVTVNDDSRLPALLQAGIEPRFLKADLQTQGIQAAAELPDDEKVAVIDLPDGDAASSYLLASRNFYVITRYNRSTFYAMAVIELANALRLARTELVSSR